MNNTLLATWRLEARSCFTTLVIPDGCRDLIFKHVYGEKPQWFLSSLSNSTYGVTVEKGDIFTGYRLKPGTSIDETGLLATIQGGVLTSADVFSRLENHTQLSNPLSDALNCLASGAVSVASAAGQLGVSQRSLQRLVRQGTEQSPIYWIQLARVRRAGRAMHETKSLAEIAFDYGYADQSHMNREFMRWLAISPMNLRKGARQGEQLREPGFA